MDDRMFIATTYLENLFNDVSIVFQLSDPQLVALWDTELINLRGFAQ